MKIRRARKDDLKILTDIYNQAILTQKCTADMDTFTVEERRAWFEARDDKYPLYVAEEETVIGYAYLSAYRPGRRAMDGTVEVSYYLDLEATGKGIGSKLLSFMIDEAKRLNYKTIVAILLDVNEASKGLLRKYDFEEWGRIKAIAEFDNHTCDHLYFGRKL
ncbi:N-acetyltransferase family protein [Acidaminobacter sp. JC074]|uniref:GNAT family N-acetyltransferase n=1 Tax=Acidaminobacter sp. JC074 TaxID=2530199 RepID=UPI001F1157E5|nr:GNAT family N-acetyltransferase [Acidaminobacter sp. JC074]MCH4888964.1 N-acetyltransferase family protein [Acidaminobacter sp. JC074]